MQLTYPAELAGLHYGVRTTVAGLLISVYGYSDTLATLAQVGSHSMLALRCGRDTDVLQGPLFLGNACLWPDYLWAAAYTIT